MNQPASAMIELHRGKQKGHFEKCPGARRRTERPTELNAVYRIADPLFNSSDAVQDARAR